MRLQRLQNKAARLVFSCGRDQPSASLLDELHWLPVKQRVHFKLLLYIFKCINTQAPGYLIDLIHLLNSSVALGLRSRLRSSSDLTRLWVPRSFRKAGDASFAIGAPKIWNELPTEIREVESVSGFKRMLKTHLYPD